MGELLRSMRAVKGEIHQILLQNPAARNNDIILISDLAAKRGLLLNTNVTTFLLAMSNGRFPGFETIRRTRQKLQELHVELRGTNTETRQFVGQQTREEIQRGNTGLSTQSK